MPIHKLVRFASASVLVLAASAFAGAAPIVGNVHFIGTGVFNGTPAAATSISFPWSVEIAENISDGSYAGLNAATTAVFQNLAMGPQFNLPELNIDNLWSFSDGGLTYSFDLTKITLNEMAGTQRVLEGLGVAQITGFDDTPGFWTLSTSGTSASVSFSSFTSSVPDSGTSALLLGIALVAMSAVVHRTRRA
jgi:hypothetical protein